MKAQIFKTVVVFLLATQYVVAQQPVIQNYRPVSKLGLTVFEPVKDDVEFTGLNVRIGGAFAQQFQALDHTNQYTIDYLASPELFPTPDKTMLVADIKNGFNLAAANFNIDVQLDDGIRMELITYLSARHHNEAWVKGGYIQFDKLPFLKSDAVDNFMKFTTIRIGHMEVNYGDGHFRRTDNGNAIFNPFVGNYIMDAFDTQIGGEVYFRSNGFLGMLGISEGEIKGDVKGTNVNSGAAFYGKVGYDNQLNEDVRLRLTGSMYTTEDANATNHIYDGDRGGSRYFYAVEPQMFMSRSGVLTSINAVDKAQSGRYSPGFSNKVTSFMLNPFVKFQGFEFFGLMETSKGYRGTDEAAERSVNQLSGELIYRLFGNESVYVGARYNQVFGELESGLTDASISRVQLGAGWFLGDHVLAKLEYVNQQYNDYPIGHYFENAEFNGIMFEAVIGF